VVAALARHAATSLSAVPDLVRLLLDRTSLGRTSLPSLRYMTVAGGSLRHELALAIAGRIAPAQFFVMYGQTEATARLAYVPPEHLEQLPAGCIGRAIPGVELEIVDESGSRVATGEMGELRARGPNVMQGYWRDPEGTAERIRDGWLSTGDLAAMDEKGWIYHRGRRNAIVKIAGFRVHSGELEEFAVRRLSVGQAVAVPFEAPQIGTRLALYVIRPAASVVTVAEMIARCRAELPRQLVPHIIRVLDDFPLNAAMKVDRMLLSQIAEQETTPARVRA
jgi:long-chain acyl-CoA synthetase